MADTADTITYDLSSIDQSIIRTYVRYCLCFPHDNDEKVAREEVAGKLAASVKRAITYMPILAGNVHLVSDDDAHQDPISVAPLRKGDTQRGRVEARVTLAQVNDFEPTIKSLSVDDFPHTYEELNASKMPANAFIDDILTPLPDSPDSTKGAPAFAVQANFIQGGVLVCMYLHHSVADLKGLAAMMRYMSSPKERFPGIQHTLQSLKDDAMESSRLRDRLCGSRGVEANKMEHPEYDTSVRHALAPSQGTSRVLAMSLEMLDGTRDMINERFQYMNDEPGVHLSAFDCLAAVLWKGITRARWPPSMWPPGSKEAKMGSKILIPADMSKRIDPPLPEHNIGNSCLFSVAQEEDLVKLTAPFDIGSLAKLAHRIRRGVSGMHDDKARSAIALINEREDVRSVNHPNIDFERDVFITNWANLPVDEESTLGLGLGTPQWARKVSRNQSACGCNLLPLKKAEGVWEVMVSLTEEAMGRLLDDPGLAPFVLHVA